MKSLDAIHRLDWMQPVSGHSSSVHYGTNAAYGVPNIWDGELGRNYKVQYNCYVSKYKDTFVTVDLYLGSPYSVNAVSIFNCDFQSASSEFPFTL